MLAGGAHPALSIDERLVSLGSTPIDQECCVFKVHHRLRQINVAAYEPDLLAIGPYHHGKDHLSFMEKHKLRFLQRMLKRRDENSAERYITAMIEKEETARRFYADQFPELSKEKFVEMMLLDGCFIIELFRIHRDAIFHVLELDQISQSVENEPIFQTNWMINGIMRDLLLFENQLPFFILTELFEMSEGCNQQYDYVRERVPTRLLDRALAFFCLTLELSCELKVNGSSYVSDANIKHLLGLIHKAMSPLPKVKKSQRGMKFEETHKSKDLVGPNENEDWMSVPYATDLQDVGAKIEQAMKFKDRLFGELKKEEWKPIPNVIELQEAGVKFNKAETGNLFHIKFNNGIMEIPPLNILDNTESVFRNLIAYEQHSQQSNLNYVTDFATLMDYLINTPKDVELLRRNGIINSWMGDDEVVSNMFNKICCYTHFSRDFYYADIIKQVNKHCHRRWNVRMAKLRRDYFNSPWALLSVLAAILLLLLAIAQTVFSILSYVFN
ncbi:UPF0481 protein At3g47200-like [Carya illinoinensis]|uniref:UPF0481 protein At3g47200-like n=1 Tax=Carya illinoinensis TaxID=32201 RepID=UPI001C71C5E4|nr:UPF0481 protein At3g47200-like [Carya illinoinensis]XP_042988741.1 UPF0481 protein At3g47200-like [Carya illinoinensis]XP_042988744.1 UPF0481 protein At3g47200-like [Carya illinoinensis]